MCAAYHISYVLVGSLWARSMVQRHKYLNQTQQRPKFRSVGPSHFALVQSPHKISMKMLIVGGPDIEQSRKRMKKNVFTRRDTDRDTYNSTYITTTLPDTKPNSKPPHVLQPYYCLGHTNSKTSPGKRVPTRDLRERGGAPNHFYHR